MFKKHEILLVIPSRLASQRLPNKPLALIKGKPMVQWVFEQAQKADIAEVFVAGCSEEVLAPIDPKHRILTPKELASGSDRVFYAAQKLASNPKIVINLQGDIPFFPSYALKTLLDVFTYLPDTDVATLVAKVDDQEKFHNPNRVKAALGSIQNDVAPVYYFSRAPIQGKYNFFYEHIGVYAYKLDALKKFSLAQPSPLEIGENLEQLRGLELNLKFATGIIDIVPQSVDTAEDLAICQNT